MKTYIKYFSIIVSLIFLFFACASNSVKTTTQTKNPKEEKNHIQKIHITKSLILDTKGLKETKKIPEEIHNLRNGAIMFEKTNITILVVSSYEDINSATNTIIEKEDIIKFIFENFVGFDDGKETNKEYIKDVNPSTYVIKDDFKFNKSYIIEIENNGKKEIKVLSLYSSSDEDFERNIISSWEGVCWDKSINLNITEKFIRLITSNYQSIKKTGKWIN